MTDPTRDPGQDRLDELASAYLDGEVTGDERARVENDPQLQARVERLRAVAEAVGGGFTPLSDEDATMQRRRARLAGEDVVLAGPVAPAVRRDRRVWLPPAAVAAAVLVILALVGVLLIAAAGTGGGSADTASAGKAETAGGAATDTPSSASAAVGGTTLRELGSFADNAALRRTLEQLADVTTLAGAYQSDESTTRVKAAEVQRCDTTVRAAQSDLGDRLAFAGAEIGGRRVLVFSHPVEGSAGGTAKTQLTAVDMETCQPLFAVIR
jgi:hypothetical protein